MSDTTASPAHLGLDLVRVDLPAWKKGIGGVCAVLLAILFFVSGAWKLTDPFTWSQYLVEFRLPSALALPGALAVGTGEMVGAVLILVPRFRRWGAWLIGFLLVVFMIYIGANYGALAGKDCSCFPLVKRAVGPAFFFEDGAMLVMAVLAGMWARSSENLRAALVILGTVIVFGGVSFGVNSARASGLQAPPSITVDGKPFSLQEGKVFLFFYDPTCPHCEAAARKLAKLKWNDTTIVAVPTDTPQFAASFLHDTGLKAGTSNDLALLTKTFKFANGPYGVALVRGHEKGVVDVGGFDKVNEPAATLRPLGFVE
ncbi:MAG TPA: MauE/DoxX family redox-associated membrane protein [Bryobacteraceae bacterium]|nr:MauE/DoxX family redox-associated membrane protein [Bryobacteraceae bacterium]